MAMLSPSPGSAPRLVDGPSAAPATLLLAHGAGAPMDSPFLQVIAEELAQRGWRVIRFEFPYMARRRSTGKQQAPDRQPLLLDTWRQQVQRATTEGPVLIGGKSMGGRMASLVADELFAAGSVLGCVCLGYPFHPPGKPDQLRTAHLAAMAAPCLILQGERDSFGRRGEIEMEALSPAIEIAWIPDGDHSFKPTKRSGLSEAANLGLAIDLCDRFMTSCCRDRSDG